MHPDPQRTLTALINMLDDPDDRVFDAVSRQIVTMGTDALPLLVTAMDNTLDETVSGKIAGLLDQIHQADLLEIFRKWVRSEDHDLLEGFLLVSRTLYRNIDKTEIQAQIAQIKSDIWIELHDDLTALENVRVINHVLFRVHHFEGNRQDISAPDNSYLNKLLENRKGNPLSLGLLYLILARQLNLPLTGVDLPQHFILAYLSSDGIPQPDAGDVLFYVNPFNNGTMFTRREIDQFLGQMKIKPEPSFYKPCTNLDIIRKLIRNLIFSYSGKGMQERLGELENLLDACT